MPPQPRMRRHLVAQIRRLLEAEIAPIVVVRGPRQVGKTTAQFQIIADLLDEGVPPTNILRVQFDELASLRGIEAPILSISNGLNGRSPTIVSTHWRETAGRLISSSTRSRTSMAGPRNSSLLWTTPR